MLFRGSKTLTASQFADTTAITGGTFNADTQNQITQYFFEMPSQYLDVALNLERSRATGVLDSQKLWDQERGAITQEVTRDNSSATFRLFAKAMRTCFAGTPYADVGARHRRELQAHPGPRPQGVLRALVPSEQRDLRHRRQRRPAGDDREGARALRRHPGGEAAGAPAGPPAAAHAADAARQQLRPDRRSTSSRTACRATTTRTISRRRSSTTCSTASAARCTSCRRPGKALGTFAQSQTSPKAGHDARRFGGPGHDDRRVRRSPTSKR